MTRQNFLHLLKLEELTFQMSQKPKLYDEGFGHSASGSLRDTHTHTHTSVHYCGITALTTMWRARKNLILAFGERPWQSDGDLYAVNRLDLG